MFKKLFGRGDTSAEAPAQNPDRILDNPGKLATGDAIVIGFDEHRELSNAELFVEKVSGLDLAAKSGYERRLLHLGQTSDHRPLLMWLHNEGAGEQLAFAYGAAQPHVEAMMNVEQFAELFTPDRDYLVEVDSLAQAADNPWIADKYVQDQAHEVYWLDGDPNDLKATSRMSNDEQACDYFRLSSKDKTAAIEVFVFDGGRTDVYFINYLPLYKIETMMPGA
ncbi:MAG: hypothetical protein OSB58_02640 [Alphaproteobacteria bacterium]|jgi:hypothetical protein|nr:hypothetical protein [Alphaproteobacteria bacterium]